MGIMSRPPCPTSGPPRHPARQGRAALERHCRDELSEAEAAELARRGLGVETFSATAMSSWASFLTTSECRQVCAMPEVQCELPLVPTGSWLSMLEAATEGLPHAVSVADAGPPGRGL